MTPLNKELVDKAWAAFVEEGNKANREELPNAPLLEFEPGHELLGKRLITAALEASPIGEMCKLLNELASLIRVSGVTHSEMVSARRKIDAALAKVTGGESGE